VLRRRYEEQLTRLEGARDRVEHKVRERAEAMIESYTRKLDRTLEQLAVQKKDSKRADDLKRKAEKLVDQLEEHAVKPVVEKQVKEERLPKDAVLVRGTRVRIAGVNQDGVVEEPPEDGKVVVMMGAMRVTVPLSSLRRARGGPEPEPPKREATHSRIAMEKARSFSPELHLRGLRVEPALLEVEKYLDTMCQGKSIEKLPIKFKAVCSDLVEGKKFVFEKGKLSTAIRASCTIPAIFSPIRTEGKLLIDGGAVDPIPVSELSPGKGEKIVAVGLYSKIFPKSYRKLAKANITQIAYASMQVMVCRLSEKNVDMADIKILPEVEDINVLNFVKAKKYIDIGYEAAMKQMPEIEKLFL